MLNRTHIFYRHTTNRPSSTVFSFHVRVCVIFQLCCQVLFPQFYWLCDEGLLIVSSTNLHTAQWKEQQAEGRGCGGAVDAGTSLLCQIEWKERGKKTYSFDPFSCGFYLQFLGFKSWNIWLLSETSEVFEKLCGNLFRWNAYVCYF